MALLPLHRETLERPSLPHSRPCSRGEGWGASSPTWPSNEEDSSWISQLASANQHREPRQAIPLNHREQKEGVLSQWYLAPELFQPSGTSLSRFLTPCSDFQKPRHSGPWGTLDLPPSRLALPHVGLSLGSRSRGYVIQQAWMRMGPSMQHALNSECALLH